MTIEHVHIVAVTLITAVTDTTYISFDGIESTYYKAVDLLDPNISHFYFIFRVTLAGFSRFTTYIMTNSDLTRYLSCQNIHAYKDNYWILTDDHHYQSGQDEIEILKKAIIG